MAYITCNKIHIRNIAIKCVFQRKENDFMLLNNLEKRR